ncbi:MAG: hypothetical protein ABIB71_02770 [Candidatus Woesearchaeota archaeon]
MAKKEYEFTNKKLEKLTRRVQEAVKKGTYPKYKGMSTMELLRELRKN